MRSPRLAALAVTAVLVGGCSDDPPQEVDIHTLETRIARELADTYPGVRVTCPDQVPIRAGEGFDCSVHGMGGTRVIVVKILDSSGRTSWAVNAHL